MHLLFVHIMHLLLLCIFNNYVFIIQCLHVMGLLSIDIIHLIFAYFQYSFGVNINLLYLNIIYVCLYILFIY